MRPKIAIPRSTHVLNLCTDYFSGVRFRVRFFGIAALLVSPASVEDSDRKRDTRRPKQITYPFSIFYRGSDPVLDQENVIILWRFSKAEACSYS